MTNDEFSNDEGSLNDESERVSGNSGRFVIRYSSFPRHSSFVIRHF